MNLEGIRRVENYLSLFGSKVISILVIPPMLLIYALFLDWKSALTMFLVMPVIIAFMILLGQVARSRATQRYQSYRTLANHFVDSLRGLETLKLLGLSAVYAKTVGAMSENYRKATMSTLTIAFMSSFALDFFSTLSVAIIALFLGLRLMDGTLLLAPALTMLILAPEYFAPIREFGGDYHATLDGKKALEDIQTVLELPEPTACPAGQQIMPWTESGHLVITDVVVGENPTDSTENTANRLESFSFSWRGLGKIGIIGASGAGKSTLIELLGGFLQPKSGTIRINDIQMPHLGHHNWQKQVIYIPQRPYIFQATLADNIRFYTSQATENQVRQAAHQAGLDELVSTLPLGLHEMIGEGGRALSGGQEQRVALARAFLDAKRRILLFDEPTAHIDIETEYELKKNMLPLMESRLVFFATHRLHWMREMDWVLLLDRGGLVAQGRPEELLKHHAYQALLMDITPSQGTNV
jgi:ATP-binding cassette subfamily C protein CydD